MNEDNSSDVLSLFKLQSLFEHSTIGIVLAKLTGEIEMINPFAEKQFGYDRRELKGEMVEKLIPAEFSDRHKDHRRNYSRTPISRPMGIGLDLHGQKKDGTKFPVEISLSHYKINGTSYVVAFVNDITIRKQNEEVILKHKGEIEQLNINLEKRVEDRTLVLRETLLQLEQSRNELTAALEKEKELSELKSRFVSMASHEFRTPLSTILSSASLIEKYQKEEEKDRREKHVNRIKENVKNLNEILEDFLSLGKLEEGLIKTKFEKVDIQNLIKDVVHDMNESKKTGQVIDIQCTGEQAFVTDKHLLKNIMLNLASNAIKFSHDNGRILIKASIGINHLSMSITDNGIGISEEDQQHLFDRFFRGRNALNIKGTGLGLHIVSKYLELLHGSMSIKSIINEGTEIMINIKGTDQTFS